MSESKKKKRKHRAARAAPSDLSVCSLPVYLAPEWKTSPALPPGAVPIWHRPVFLATASGRAHIARQTIGTCTISEPVDGTHETLGAPITIDGLVFRDSRNQYVRVEGTLVVCSSGVLTVTCAVKK